ncbi:PREDICTED: suppressor of Mek1-like [Polistes dominula]|uniref:Suppressor of Mek1-like n=1 Tax=Polistes dominula TaxID=743375 RepID=A0ABM1HXE4_POLDO|nr:PREDICTED: suppressor of Mek1-like [Polistes dominula]
MAVTTSCEETNMVVPFHKGLSEWWSEETEYVFQRIERWAAFARGYNRLRSERLSKGRLTMNEEHNSRWSISSNKLIIEEETSWNPSFHKLKRSRRRSRQEEEMKINHFRDSVFGYRSNDNLDSTCLETYRYDHSIYFKTIGEIRNNKKNSTTINNNDDNNDDDSKENVSLDCEDEDIEIEVDHEVEETDEVVDIEDEIEEIDDEVEDIEDEVDQTTFVYDSIDEQFYLENDHTRNNEFESNKSDVGVWPIVDLSKLDLNSKMSDESSNDKKNEVEWTIETNNNNNNNNNNNYMRKENMESKMDYYQNEKRFNYESKQDELKKDEGDEDTTKGIFTFKMIKHRPSRMIKRSTVCGDNNVIWPGILLNYTRNVDIQSTESPHHHHHHHHHHHYYSNNFK